MSHGPRLLAVAEYREGLEILADRANSARRLLKLYRFECIAVPNGITGTKFGDRKTDANPKGV